jgi:hypothetical protein
MIAEILFNVLAVALIIMIFAVVVKGKKYEGVFDKKVLNFFLLGLFFFMFKLIVSLFVDFNLGSILFSKSALYVYDYLTVACFFFGAYTLKDLVLTGE